MKKEITAKFNSRCSVTGAKICKGEKMLYDYSTKKCYSLKSQSENNSIADFIQANENSYFDNFCQNNNI